MRFIKIILLILCFSNCFAQPRYVENRTINIQTMFLNEKRIFKKGDSSIRNNMIYLIDKCRRSEVWTNIISKLDDNYDNFIYKNDTMRIKMVLPAHYGLQDIVIRKLNFVKGDFTIDLLQYIKENHDSKYSYLDINNFPEDCLPYRKEEKE